MPGPVLRNGIKINLFTFWLWNVDPSGVFHSKPCTGSLNISRLSGIAINVAMCTSKLSKAVHTQILFSVNTLKSNWRPVSICLFSFDMFTLEWFHRWSWINIERGLALWLRFSAASTGKTGPNSTRGSVEIWVSTQKNNPTGGHAVKHQKFKQVRLLIFPASLINLQFCL
jgi:hypothetical protein